MKGYKVFNSDWSCKGFQYGVGQTYEMAEKPKCCSRGFHFCESILSCFNYYSFDPNNKVAEVEALGDIDTGADGDKACTNKIKIVRELTWEEVLSMCNTGNCNTGYGNTGHRNTGNRNSGDWNTGDWNISSHNAGCFNTEGYTIMFFNKPSSWSYSDWLESKAKSIIDTCPVNDLKWVSASKMSEEEKAAHPDYEVTGGYLKEVACTQADKLAWWKNLLNEEREVVQTLPNFDEDIFLQCIGAK